MRLQPAEYIGFVDGETERLIEAARSVPPSSPVPSAPGWTVADLLWHLTEVQTFWATIVSERLPSPDGYRKPLRPADDNLVDALDSAKTFLVSTLSATDPATPCYTWSDQQNAGFIMRRQAHEALIHRADAELAAGLGPSLDLALALDGIDEILRVMIGGIPEWAMFTDGGRTIRIDAGEQAWNLLVGRMAGTSPNSGTTYDIDAAVVVDEVHQPDTIISGSPGKLDLWLWGRAPLVAVEVQGDQGLAGLLREMAAEATQ